MATHDPAQGSPVRPHDSCGLGPPAQVIGGGGEGNFPLGLQPRRSASSTSGEVPGLPAPAFTAALLTMSVALVPIALGLSHDWPDLSLAVMIGLPPGLLPVPLAVPTQNYNQVSFIQQPHTPQPA